MVISPKYEQIKSFKIIKRDGREEPFYLEKLVKVLKWAAETVDHGETYIESLLNEVVLKITDKMRIQDLYDSLIEISVSKISAIVPAWDNIAKYLYLLKIYKEDFNLKRIGTYPPLQKFLNKGIEKGVYDKAIVDTFTEEELDDLSSYINPDRDLLFNYKGLCLFFSKYCKNSNDKFKSRKIELPQITYMVSAMQSHFNEPHSNKAEIKARLKNIMKCYDNLSTHKVTFSTPRLMFGLGNNPQFASCVLITPDDDTNSLNQTDAFAAVYSKNSGGIAIDVSYIRSSGSSISNHVGKSDGPIPFIKRYEQTVMSFNQMGVRSGAVIIYFPWWHMDSPDLIMLRDSGGAEEYRARRCKYGMKIHRLLLERTLKDEWITLFDPKETSILNELNGEEFNKKYIEFENNANIRSKKMKARELMELFFKVRVETGNLYAAFMDNINEQELTGRYVGMSNLCAEISVPSRRPNLISEKYYKNQDGKYEIHTIRENGEIGLCNLSSINSLSWFYMDDRDKNDLVMNLLRGMDNAIDSQFYPVAEAAWPNKSYRPIGIGITDFANLMAFEKIKYSDQKALQFTNDLLEDIYLRIYYQSMMLAKERGAYDGFKNSNWAKGLTPYHLSRFRKENILNIDFKNDKLWNELGNKIKQNGVRFSLHAAIPPSSTSGKVTNATEACEPIMDLFYVETGTHILPTVVKGRGETRKYYEKCWDIEPRRILELAAIRQVYLDQSQSFNQYYVRPDSITELFTDLMYAEKLGLKSVYYLKTPKLETDLECSSCSV